MTRLLDPISTVAVILGAHDWTKAGLPRALSFRRSAAHLHAFLIGRPSGGLGFEPDQVLNLFDDPPHLLLSLLAFGRQLVVLSESVVIRPILLKTFSFTTLATAPPRMEDTFTYWCGTAWRE